MQNRGSATIDVVFKRFILCSLKAPFLHQYLKTLWRIMKGKKFKRSNATCYNVDEPQKQYAKRKIPVLLCDSIFVRCSKGPSVGTESRWVVARDWVQKGRVTVSQLQVSSGWWKCSKIRLWWWLQNSVNTLTIMELYTENRGILWYVNYILNYILIKLHENRCGFTNSLS